MIVVQEQRSRQYVVDVLNRLGYKELADEASRDLPDPVDVDQLPTWFMQRGYSWDNDVVSRMGGSP